MLGYRAFLTVPAAGPDLLERVGEQLHDHARTRGWADVDLLAPGAHHLLTGVLATTQRSDSPDGSWTVRVSIDKGSMLALVHNGTREGSTRELRLAKGTTMTKSGIETYHEDDQWKSRRTGSGRAFSVGGTKAEQQDAGREAAKRDGVEHTIKNLDGTIGAKNSYGNDPHPPKG